MTPPHATTDPATEPLPMLASSRESRFDTVISRPYLGVGLATLGASVLAYFTFLQGFFPAGVPESWITVLGLATIAVATGVVTTLPAILQVRGSAALLDREAELQRRLMPALVTGMEGVLERWTDVLWSLLNVEGSEELDPDLDFELHVFIRIGGHHRIVGSSTATSCSVRWIELRDGEGMIGRVYERNAPVVAVMNDDFTATLFTGLGGAIGDQPPLRAANLEKCDPSVKWVYAAPIFDREDGVPRESRTIGVCTVDGLRSMGGALAFDARLRVLVEEITAQLAPFVGAMRSLNLPSDSAFER